MIEAKLADLCMQFQNQVVLRTGLVCKSTYDKEEIKLFPMIEADMSEINEKREVLQNTKLYSFFLKADFKMVQRLRKRVAPFIGTIITKNSPYQIKVKVCQNKKYVEEVQKLEVVFAQNNIEWKTPCIPYLNKMFDVYVIESNLPWYEEIEDIVIDFEEYTPWIVKNVMPVWNLEKLEMITDLRPERVESTLQYIHVINGRRLDQNAKYLITDTSLELTRQDTIRGIEIVCKEEKEKVWQMYRVEEQIPENSEYEIFGNKSRNDRINPVRTKGAVTRIINGLGYRERFILKRVEIGNIEEGHTGKYVLKLFFKSEVKDYLQEDILKYLITEVERLYPEMECNVELL